MKKLNISKKNIFIFLVTFLILSTNSIKSQCTASFTPVYNLNGNVTFLNNSSGYQVGNTWWNWNFGDGKPNDYNFDSNHTYVSNGTYTVTLSIISGSMNGCTSTYTMSVNIVNSPCNTPIFASFTSTLGIAGTYSVTSTSTGTTGLAVHSYSWGDGTNSVGANQTHTYAANTGYSVMMVINDGLCTDTAYDWISVTSVGCALIASYTSSNNINGLVDFSTTTTGTVMGDTYNWNFGDGTTGNGQFPTHLYANNGVYNVTHSVARFSGSLITCFDQTTNTISVSNATCNVIPNFNYTVNGGGVVNYASTSTGTLPGTVFNWDFGDGTTGSGISTSHTYSNGGVHNVNLTTIVAPNCIASISQSPNINTIPCVANSNFTLVYGGTPTYWIANPAYFGNVINAEWAWGDGSFSYQMFASHTYSIPGLYNICLSVTVSCASTSSSCASYNIFKTNYNPSALMYHISVLPKTSIETSIKSYYNTEQNFNLYPNPSNEELNISLNENTIINYIRVFDINGKNVLSSESLWPNENKLNVSKLSNGLYFLELKTEKDVFKTKFVISR